MNQMLSVDEAVQAAISELEEYTGWKYLKSQRCLKKKVKDIEITIDFFTSIVFTSVIFKRYSSNALTLLVNKRNTKILKTNKKTFFIYSHL